MPNDEEDSNDDDDVDICSHVVVAVFDVVYNVKQCKQHLNKYGYNKCHIERARW